MKLNIKTIALCAFLAFGLTSCEEDGYEDYDQTVASTPALAMSGEWFITISDAADGTVYAENALHKTYDSNDGKLFITDRAPAPVLFYGWALETKMDYDLNNLTFSATGTANAADGSIVNITEGKILKNAAHSTDGNVTDSIYFKGSFDYAPTQVLIFSGHKRTGFEEDEH